MEIAKLLQLKEEEEVKLDAEKMYFVTNYNGMYQIVDAYTGEESFAHEKDCLKKTIETVEVEKEVENRILTRKLYHFKTVDKKEDVIFIGRVSMIDDLEYMKLSNNVLIGKSKNVGNKVDLYFFNKVLETSFANYYEYHSDMVIRDEDKSIKWVGVLKDLVTGSETHQVKSKY